MSEDIASTEIRDGSFVVKLNTTRKDAVLNDNYTISIILNNGEKLVLVKPK